MKEVHLSFHSNGYNPNPLKSIDVIALRLDSCVEVLGGWCLGKVCSVMGRKSKTSQAPLSRTQGRGF